MWSGSMAFQKSSSPPRTINLRASEAFGAKTTKRDYRFSSQAHEYGWDQAHRINGMSYQHSQCHKSECKRPGCLRSDCRHENALRQSSPQAHVLPGGRTRSNGERCDVIRDNQCVRFARPPIVSPKAAPRKKHSILSAPSMARIIKNLEGKKVTTEELSAPKVKSDDCRVRFSGMPDKSCCSNICIHQQAKDDKATMSGQTATTTTASIVAECTCFLESREGKSKEKYSSRPKSLARSDNAKHDLKSSPSIFSIEVANRNDLSEEFVELPKLLALMRSQDKDTQWRALQLIKEHVAQSVNVHNAIIKLDVVRRVEDLLMRLRRIDKMANAKEITLLLRIYVTMSAYVIGAEAIAKRPQLLREFYRIVNNNEKDMKRAAKILANLSMKPDVLKILRSKNSKAFIYLTRIFSRNPSKLYYAKNLWLHLSHFLEADPDEAIAAGFFELLYRRTLTKMPQYHLQNMKCLSMLLCCREGLCRFDAADGIFMLYQSFIHNSRCCNEYLVRTLLNSLMSRRCLWRCNAFSDLPDILLRLAQQRDYPLQQLYCFKAMRLMAEMTCIRRYMSLQLILPLREIVCESSLNRCTRDELVLSLSRRIYDNGIQF